MKPKFYTKLITLVAGFMMLANVNVAMAQDYYDFKSGQLYYKIIDATAKTVKVVSELDYHNNDAISYNEGNRPSGDITIPATVVNPKDNKIYSVKEISSFVFDNCELRDVVISEGIEVIRVVAFDNSLIMNALYIPASVTKIEEGFMFSCVFYPVENPLRIAKGNKNYTIIDHILYSIDKKTLLLCPSYTFIKYTIPNTVTKIAHYAFCATVLEEIVIPASVTNIGELVFHGCKELRSIHCKVDDPSKISMGEHVFNFVPINTCTLYVPTGSKAKYQAAPQWKDFTNIVEKDIEKYPLWVAGTQVDENNASDIKGEGITGKVSYDPDTKTLTLNGATIDGGANNGIFNEGIDNLKIELIGNNTVSNTAESGNSAI
ncbi:MAG TPA: leucine-rich repeat domain-containing protein, partial [Bacteroidales bacterium]|nr:leucine-rich repeat domain-containing protein [Bacteroidales bacterium]